MVLNRRHFNGSYIKSTGVNAYFLGRVVSPGRINMSFINDHGQSCSTVTLTANTPSTKDLVSTSVETIADDDHLSATATALPPLNCSWTTKWFKGSQAPFAALSLHETAAGPLQGLCATEGDDGECAVVRADQLPRSNAKPQRIVQVNARVSGRLVVLAATLCPGGACGMVGG
jgi:hypothetical protein